MKKRNFFKSVVSISILISILGFSFVLFTPWIEVVLGTDFTFLEKRQGTIMIGVAISFFISIFAVFHFIKDGKDFFKVTKFKDLFKLVLNIMYPSLLISLVIIFSLNIFLLNSFELLAIMLVAIPVFFVLYFYIISVISLIIFKTEDLVRIVLILISLPILLYSVYAFITYSDKNQISPKSSSECQGTGDESFIRSKMDQMDRDILELNKVGERKYYIRYISWSSGTAVNGDEILDYSNSPCND
jgi:hypothetical protein